MSWASESILRNNGGDPIPQIWDEAQQKFVPYEIMNFYGATVANRPAANAVPAGAVYVSIDTREVWQSNGTNWRVR